MISNLHIKNVATIKEINIQLDEGLNIFTGETGAGKSILIDSISSVLGFRTSKNMIRQGEKEAYISAMFINNSKNVINTVKNLGYDIDEDLIINRTINIDGKNVCRVNGKLATVNILKEIGEVIVDIHGQHDNGYLLQEKNHQKLIDNYAGLSDKIFDYKSDFKKVSEIKKNIEVLIEQENNNADELEFLKHKIKDLESLNIKKGEFEELLKKQKIYKIKEDLILKLKSSYNLLSDNEDSIISNFSRVDKNISAISDLDKVYNNLSEKIKSIYYNIEDICLEISNLISENNYGDNDIEQIENRIYDLNRIKNKYYIDLDEVDDLLLSMYDNIKQIEDRNTYIDKLESEAEEILKKIKNKASELSKLRLIACEKFVKDIKGELTFLNMPNIEVSFKNNIGKLTSNGFDNIILNISTNKGQDAKSISKVASGGELSRIMLSIKTLLLEKQNFGVLIFDEIDSGVSGETSLKIGIKLRNISKYSQVICITHSAQIASYAKNHMKIIKHTDNSSTFTKIKKLNIKERQEELAKIISGGNITKKSLDNASEILNNAIEF